MKDNKPEKDELDKTVESFSPYHRSTLIPFFKTTRVEIIYDDKKEPPFKIK